MQEFRNSPIKSQLDMVATMRDRAIQASINELRKQDDLTITLRTFLRNGVDINSLSDASGLSVDAIRRRVRSELVLGEDMDSLTGAR